MEDNKKLPLVSIISVDYNQAEVSCEMLESLKRITYPNIEVIVVDNASKNGTGEIIKYQHPWIQFIQSNTNGGFAAENNQGIRIAKGKYILLLNNDMEVEETFLEPLNRIYAARYIKAIGWYFNSSNSINNAIN